MADMQEIQLNLVVSAQNLAGEALSGVRSALEELFNTISSLRESIARPIKAAIEVSGVEIPQKLENDFKGAANIIDAEMKQASEAASNALIPIEETSLQVTQNIENNFRHARDVIDAEFKVIGEEVQKLEREFQKAAQVPIPGGGGKGLKGLFSIEGQMNTLYAGMGLGAAAAPIMGFVKEAVKDYADLDKQITAVNVELNKEKLNTSDVVKLSQELPLTANEIAQGLYRIAGAGYSLADSNKIVRYAAIDAAAGQTDIDTASQALIKVMQAYGIKVDDVRKVSDALFAANSSGTMKFKELAASIGTVAGIAANAGVDYHELLAATAALTNQGLSAQRATEGLRALLVGIQNPTKQAAAEAQKLGIHWDAATLKARGLKYMLNQAWQATHGNTEEMKKLIPNIAAYTAAIDLAGKGSGSFDQALGNINNSAGATDKAFDKLKQSAEYNLEEFSKAWENVKLIFAENVLPAITMVLNKVKGLFEWFGHLSKPVQKLISYGVLIAGTFLSIGSAFFMTLSAIGGIVTGFEELSVAFPELGAAIGTAVDFALGPWGLLIGAIAIGALAIINHWKQIETWVKKTFGIDLPNTFKQFQTTAQKASKDIGNAFSGVRKDIEKSFGDVWKVINKEFGNSLKKMKPDIAAGMKEIQKTWNDAWGAIKKTFVDVANALKKAWDDSWKKMKPDIINGVKEVKKWWDQTWPIMRKTFQDVWNAIKKVFQDEWKKVGPNIISGIKEVKKFWDQEWPTIKSIFQKVWNSVSKTFQDAWKKIGPAIISGIKEVQKWWDEVWPEIKQVFGPIWEKIKSDIKDGLDFINKHWDQIWGMIKATFKGVWDAIVGIIKTLWHTVSGLILVGLDILNGKWGKAWKDMKKTFGNVSKDIGTTAKKLIGDAKDWGKNLLKMLADGIKHELPNIEKSITGVADKIKKILGFHSPTEEGPASDSDTWAPNFMKMFAGGIEDNQNLVELAVTHTAQLLRKGLAPSVKAKIYHEQQHLFPMLRPLLATPAKPIIERADPFLEADTKTYDWVSGHTSHHPTTSYYDFLPGHTSHHHTVININIDGRSHKTDRELAEHVATIITRHIKTHR